MAKLAEVEVGQVWEVRWHDGSFTQVEILGRKLYNVVSRQHGRSVIGSKVRFTARNLKTGRVVTIKSAAKLRRRVS